MRLLLIAVLPDRMQLQEIPVAFRIRFFAVHGQATAVLLLVAFVGKASTSLFCLRSL